jgi:hypothetical protein
MNAPPKESNKPVKPLSPEEAAKLAEIDLIIKKSNRDEDSASLDKCKAFALVHDGQLYRKDFKSMQEFGLSYDIKPTVTSRLKRAGQIYFKLAPLWDEDDVVAPTSAWQLLPLARLKTDEDQRAGWLAAVISSDGKVPSEAKVKEAVATLLSAKAQDTTAQAVDSRKDPAAHLSRALDDITKTIQELSPQIKATEQPDLANKLRALQKLSGEKASAMEVSTPPPRPIRFPKLRHRGKTFIDPEVRLTWAYLKAAGFFRF